MTKMKKVLALGLVVASLLLFPLQGFAADQVNSEVGISFYQPTSANQIVPMVKVKRTKEPDRFVKGVEQFNESGRYPKTNEKERISLTLIGLLLFIISFIVIVRKRSRYAD